MFHNNSVQKPVASQITLRMLSCVKIADTDIQEQKHWKQPSFCAGNAQAIFSIPRSHENLVLSVLEVPYNLGSKISKLKIKCKSNIYFRKLCTSLPAHWSNSVQSQWQAHAHLKASRPADVDATLLWTIYRQPIEWEALANESRLLRVSIWLRLGWIRRCWVISLWQRELQSWLS